MENLGVPVVLDDRVRREVVPQHDALVGDIKIPLPLGANTLDLRVLHALDIAD